MKSLKKFVGSSIRYQDFLAAQFEDRIAAYFFDLTLIFILHFSIVNYFQVDISFWVYFVEVALYFTLSHYLWKATLGKWIFKLRVSNLKEDHELKFIEILGRETIGRVVSSSLLFVGYLWCIFSEDQTGWHDKIFSSKVISFKPQGITTLKSLFRSLLIAGSFVLVMLTTFALHQILSPLPLNQIVNKLNASGLSIEKFSGNLFKGFKAEKLKYEGEKLLLEFENIELKVKFNVFSFTKPFLQISEINMGSGQVHAQEPNENEVTAKYFLKKLSSKLSWFSSRENLPINLISIDDLVFNGQVGVQDVFTFKDPSFKTVKLSNINLDKNGSIKIDNVELSGEQIKIQFPFFKMSNESIHLEKGSKIQILSLNSDLLLNQEINFELFGNLQESLESKDAGVAVVLGEARYTVENLSLRGFQNKIQINVNQNEVQVVSDQWHPFLTFKKVPQIHTVNAQISFVLNEDPSETQFKDWSGSFQIKDKKFEIGAIRKFEDLNEGVQFSSYDGDVSYVLKFKEPSSDNWITAQTPTKHVSQKVDFLSYLYFDEKFRELSDEDAKFISQEGKFYTFNQNSKMNAGVPKTKSVNPLEKLSQKNDWDTVFLLSSQNLLYGDNYTKHEIFKWLESKMLTFTGGARTPIMLSWGLNVKSIDEKLSSEELMQADRAYLLGLALLYIDGSRCAVQSSTQEKIESMSEMMKISEKRFAARSASTKQKMIADVLKSEASWSNRKADTWVCSRAHPRVPASREKATLHIDHKVWLKRRPTAIKSFKVDAMNAERDN